MIVAIRSPQGEIDLITVAVNDSFHAIGSWMSVVWIGMNRFLLVEDNDRLRLEVFVSWVVAGCQRKRDVAEEGGGQGDVASHEIQRARTFCQIRRDQRTIADLLGASTVIPEVDLALKAVIRDPEAVGSSSQRVPRAERSATRQDHHVIVEDVDDEVGVGRDIGVGEAPF